MNSLKYPSTITQTSGGHYRQFKDTVNIRNDNSYYAITYQPIDKKNETHNRPSTLTLTNFKFKLPAGAVVKKVIVEYNHRKIGIQNDSPSVSVDTKMNIPAPTISLVGVSGHSGKGQAPANKWKAQKKTFKTNIDRSKINSKDFGVKINYPANTAKYKGYIGIQYIRIKLEYVMPSYNLTVSKTQGGYNKDQYKTQITLSNKNKTNHDPTVSLTAPVGLTIKTWNGPGTITKKSLRSLDWIPKLSTKVGSQNLQVVFDTDVTYPTGQTVYTGDLVVSENYSNIIKHHTVTLTEKPLTPETDTSGQLPPSYNDDTRAPDVSIKTLNINEETDYTLTVPPETVEKMIHQIYDYGIEKGLWTGTFEEEYDNVIAAGAFNYRGKESSYSYLSKNQYIKWKNTSDYWSSYFALCSLSDFIDNDYSYTLPLKGVFEGYDEIYLFLYCHRGSGVYSDVSSEPVSYWRFNIRPLESSLSAPYHTLMSPTEEELHRLGDGYSYTAQSYIRSSGKTESVDDTSTHTFTPVYLGDRRDTIVQVPNLYCDFELEFDLMADDSARSRAQFFLSAVDTYEGGMNFPYYSIGAGIHYDDSDYVEAYLRGNDSAATVVHGSTPVSEWNHFKITRQGNTFKFYAEDTLITTQTIDWLDNYSEYYLAFGNQEDSMETQVKNIVLTYGEGDEYVRDWYKNARIGVFNNRIEANCTDYINYDTDEETQDRAIQISNMYSLTGATVTLAVDKAIDITIGETTYQLSNNDSETLSNIDDPNIACTLTKKVNDTVNLTATLKDSGNNVLQVIRYIIRFNQTEYKEAYESTVDTTDYDNLTDEEILNNAEYWSEPPTNVNIYSNLECQFRYEENYPLYIIIGGDYTEADNMANVDFTEPCIIETAAYKQYETNGNYPLPIDDSIIGDGSVSELVIESQNQSSPFIFYEMDLEEDYGTNEDIAIRGIEVTADIEHSDELVLYATLKSPTGSTGQRSIILNESTSTADDVNSFSIGGFGDLWGFNTLELVDLNSWQVEMTASNILNDEESTLNFGDVHITFYVEQIDPQEISCAINDENLAYYGGFITDVKIPAGLKTDTKFLGIDGSDTNDAYRQNIREKEITLEIGLDGCNLTDTTTVLKQLVKLLVNEKDEYNRPIPKRIEFSHYKDIYWEYIIEETIESNIEISDYNIKAKLTIPSGTAYNKKSTTTNTTGYVQGLAAINPTITITPGQATTIELTENNSKQSFKMTYNTEDWAGKIVEIDCEDRIVWLKEDDDDLDPVNITGGVDFNSSWFSLKGEYEFSTINCTLRTIDYVERW